LTELDLLKLPILLLKLLLLLMMRLLLQAGYLLLQTTCAGSPHVGSRD